MELNGKSWISEDDERGALEEVGTMYNSHVELTEAQASGQAVWENQDNSTDLLVAAGFDQSIRWITQRRITYEDVTTCRDIAKPVIEVLDFLDELTAQCFKSGENLKDYLLALLKGEMPEHFGSAPQLNVFDIPDRAAVEAIMKAKIPGGHASDRGVHLFTNDAKTLIHELGAFLGLQHAQNLAYEILIEKWSEIKQKQKQTGGHAPQPGRIAAFLADVQITERFAARLKEDGEATNWKQDFAQTFRATDDDVGQVFKKLFRSENLLILMKDDKINRRDVAMFDGLKSLIFGRIPLCPYCTWPLEKSLSFPEYQCPLCFRKFSKIELGGKVPRKIRKMNQELDQWDELYRRRLNQLIDEYMQSPRWEDMETARATWERLLEAIEELNSEHGPISMDPKFSFTIIAKRRAKLVSNLSNADPAGTTRIENEIRKLDALVAGHPLAGFIAKHIAEQASPVEEQRPRSQEVVHESKPAQDLEKGERSEGQSAEGGGLKEKTKSPEKSVRSDRQAKLAKSITKGHIPQGVHNALDSLSRVLGEGDNNKREAAENYLLSQVKHSVTRAIDQRISRLSNKGEEVTVLKQLRRRVERKNTG